MKNKLSLLLCLAICLGVYSCKHDPIIPGGDIGGPVIPVDTFEMCDSNVVYFENQIFPLIASNCAIPGCHDAITAEDDVILNSYSNIINTADVDPFDPSDSDLYEVLIKTDPDDKMPPPSTGNSLSQEQISMIYNWILQGAENNYCDNSSLPCDTLNISYSLDVVPIIQQRCIGCHSSGTANGGIVMETHSQVQTLAFSGTLWGTLDHKAGFVPMPFNQQKLDKCTLSKIKSWIDDGAPNN